MKVIVENGKYFIGVPIKYYGKHNLIIFGSNFYSVDDINLDFWRKRFNDNTEIVIVKGHAIVCEGDECAIGKWAKFRKEYLDDVIELLTRAEKIEEHYDNYFDQWWMTLWFGEPLEFTACGDVEVKDYSGVSVSVREFLEHGVKIFHMKRVGDFSGFRVVSSTELENDWLYIRYTSNNTLVKYKDGVSKYQVELDGHVHPSKIEKMFPRILFDVPPEVAETPYIPSFHGTAKPIDALPANGKLYSVNGRLAWYWGSDDWAIKDGDMIYYRSKKNFYVAREFENVIAFIKNPTQKDIKALKTMKKPEIPDVPADAIDYDLRTGVVHYYGVDCGDFKCNFRYWNGKFIISALPLRDGLYDVVTNDWKEFLKDDPRKINGQLRPLGVWVRREDVKFAWDGNISIKR